MKRFQVKVCGNKFPENFRELTLLEPDYVGFIFYPKSKRFVEDESIFDIFPNAEKVLHHLPSAQPAQGARKHLRGGLSPPCFQLNEGHGHHPWSIAASDTQPELLSASTLTHKHEKPWEGCKGLSSSRWWKIRETSRGRI